MSLSARNISVTRGGRAILRDVSLELEPGAFVALIGPNGAGKSTLLSVLAGLAAPDAGGVSLDGRTLTDLTPNDLAKRRAFLPQSPRAEWPISVERVIALGLTPHLPAFGGLPSALTEKIGKALIAFDLEGRRDQAADTLSGGELARAMLARALVGEPDILIADEPMSGLDPRHRLDTFARLAAYARDGKAVIASTHDLTLSARFADRIIALHDGQVAADGPVREALTADLLSKIFDVAACVTDAGAPNAVVDFAAP